MSSSSSLLLSTAAAAAAAAALLAVAVARSRSHPGARARALASASASPERPRITIRRATLADFDAYVELWRAYLATWDVAQPTEETRLVFAKFTDAESTRARLFLAEEGGVAVGFASVLRVPHTFSSKDSLYLEDLFVSKERRGRGIATELIHFCYGLARDEDLSRVYWHSALDNDTARSLYVHVGGELQDLCMYRVNPPYPSFP